MMGLEGMRSRRTYPFSHRFRKKRRKEGRRKDGREKDNASFFSMSDAAYECVENADKASKKQARHAVVGEGGGKTL